MTFFGNFVVPFVIILCQQTFLTYFFFLHKCIAMILGSQRQVVYTLNIPGQISYWNSVPLSIRILPKHKFKVSLHQLFLRILELEDTYVDTPSLVNKLSKMNVK